jgi:hypothetical protein
MKWTESQAEYFIVYALKNIKQFDHVSYHKSMLNSYVYSLKCIKME